MVELGAVGFFPGLPILRFTIPWVSSGNTTGGVISFVSAGAV
jgi:hypothetical protein